MFSWRNTRMSAKSNIFSGNCLFHCSLYISGVGWVEVNHVGLQKNQNPGDLQRDIHCLGTKCANGIVQDREYPSSDGVPGTRNPSYWGGYRMVFCSKGSCLYTCPIWLVGEWEINLKFSCLHLRTRYALIMWGPHLIWNQGFPGPELTQLACDAGA